MYGNSCVTQELTDLNSRLFPVRRSYSFTAHFTTANESPLFVSRQGVHPGSGWDPAIVPSNCTWTTVRPVETCQSPGFWMDICGGVEVHVEVVAWICRQTKSDGTLGFKQWQHSKLRFKSLLSHSWNSWTLEVTGYHNINKLIIYDSFLFLFLKSAFRTNFKIHVKWFIF